MKKIIMVVKGDVNDADYIEKMTVFGADDETTVLGIKKLARKIKELPPYFMESRHSLNEDERMDLDDMLSYIPRGDENFIHTVTDVRLYDAVPLEI